MTDTVQFVVEEHTIVFVEPDPETVVVEEVNTIIISTDAIPGPPGLDGTDGLSAYDIAVVDGFVGTESEWLASLVGPQGASGGSYTHTQGATSDTWVVVHNLGYRPNVTVFDSGGTQVLGDITHDSVNQLTARFTSAFSGVAYAS